MSANGQKADNFRRLAELRVSNALKQLRNIGKLSNRTAYEYSGDQVAKIFRVIRAEIDIAEDKFKQSKRGSGAGEFRLD